MHDLVEKYTSAHAHRMAQFMCASQCRGQQFLEADIVCGRILDVQTWMSKGGQTGWAVAQIHEATSRAWSARRTAPCRCRSWCNAAPCGRKSRSCCRPSSCLSPEQLSSQTVQPCAALLRGLDGGQKCYSVGTEAACGCVAANLGTLPRHR